MFIGCTSWSTTEPPPNELVQKFGSLWIDFFERITTLTGLYDCANDYDGFTKSVSDPDQGNIVVLACVMGETRESFFKVLDKVKHPNLFVFVI